MVGHALDVKTSRLGRWLGRQRMQIAILIAVLEATIVAIEQDITKWTVIAVAIPLILLYLVVGRTAKSDAVRQLSWIAGASQVFAALLAILFIVIKLFIIGLIVGLAALALILLYTERPDGPRASKR